MAAAFRRDPRWLSCREIASVAHITKRGARGHLRAFHAAGIIDRIQLGNAYRYRRSDGAEAVADFQSMAHFLKELGWE